MFSICSRRLSTHVAWNHNWALKSYKTLWSIMFFFYCFKIFGVKETNSTCLLYANHCNSTAILCFYFKFFGMVSKLPITVSETHVNLPHILSAVWYSELEWENSEFRWNSELNGSSFQKSFQWDWVMLWLWRCCNNSI